MVSRLRLVVRPVATPEPSGERLPPRPVERPIPAASQPAPVVGRPPRLLGRIRDAMRAHHYSPRTEVAYVEWIRSFISRQSMVRWASSVRLLYGSGLRLFEALELRVKDVDLQKRELHVRDGKGRKDRRT